LVTSADDRPSEGLDPGVPGASARARYERLRRRDERRRREAFGRLAPLISLLAGPKKSTEAWAAGAEGEERIGAYLGQAVGAHGVLLHDRRIPGRRANLDHVAVVASGVWVIDSKHYRGRLVRRRVGGWPTTRHALFVGRRDHGALVAAAQRQRGVVARLVPSDVRVQVALCFTGVEWPLLARPFVLDGVLVTWPRALAKALTASGRLDADRRRQVAAAIARAFPAYVPAASDRPARPH
jgi:hypothetical protein